MIEMHTILNNPIILCNVHTIQHNVAINVNCEVPIMDRYQHVELNIEMVMGENGLRL